MNSKGYITLSRKFFSNYYWLEKRTFSNAEAWLDLVCQARFEAARIRKLVNGREIVLSRGEIHASLRYLSERWNWSLNRVRRFVEKSINNGEMERRTAQGESILKLCNYDTYNRLQNTGEYTGEYTDEYTGEYTGEYKTNKENKENKENKGVSSDEDTLSVGTPPDVSDTFDYRKFVERFNSETKGVFGMVKYPLGEKRKASIRARVREHGENSLYEAVIRSFGSDFLKGNNQRGFIATIDWILKPSNFEKILSGNYDNRRKAAATHGGIDEDFARHIAEGISRGELLKKNGGKRV
jgi:hypothetical protein